MSYLESNKKFWDKWSKEKGPWSTASAKELIDKARSGRIEIFVTTEKLVPETWLPKNWTGLEVLGLAAAGGQQIPILAAAGANVTSFDFSIEQLQRDIEVCEREGLKIYTKQGEMENLNCFDNESFDLIINPVSTCFTSNVKQVWKEAYRVLRKGGALIAGFNNPIVYALDLTEYEKKEMKLKYSIPYSDIDALSQEELLKKKEQSDSLEFGHSLSDLIGGQIEAGFKIDGFYEDYWGKKFNETIDTIFPQFIATKGIK